MTGMERASAVAGVYGRERELEILQAVLGGRAGPTALVIEGDAGIGKTTIWQAGIELAARTEWRVLTCRPTLSEAGLSFAGVADLLAPFAEDGLEKLPGPQRRALAAALLVEEPSDGPPNPRAVGAAVHNLLAHAAEKERVLVAIDDAQWLDQASASTLAFAVRRLPPHRVVVLETLRSEHVEPLELDTRRPLVLVERLAVGPLHVDALHAIVRARLGVSVPRPVMQRVHEISGGNPFYAVELVRTLPSKDEAFGAGDVPLPKSLLGLVETRLRAFDPSVQEALAAVGSLAAPTITVLERALPGATGALVTAERHGIIEVAGERPRFTHPLLEGAALQLLSSLERARLELRLASALDDPDQRARHLAQGTLSPDENVALEVEQAAEAAARRGSTRLAAALAEHAVRLTPAADLAASRRRRSAAADHHRAAGDLARAISRLRELRGELPAGVDRARVLVQYLPLAEDAAEVTALAEQAVAEAEGDPACLAEAARWLSQASMQRGDVEQALAFADDAAAAARRHGDPVLLVQCLGTLAHFETYFGRITEGLLEDAVELEQTTEGTSAHYSPTQILGLRLAYGDRLDEGREVLQAALRAAEAEGDEWERGNIHAHLAQLEVAAGRWRQADTYASAVVELDAQLLMPPHRALFVRALVDSRLGRLEAVRNALLAQREKALGDESSTFFIHLLNRWVLGFVELSAGDGPAAATWLGGLPEAFEAGGYRNPGVRPVLPDAIEALVAVDELDRAQDWATVLAERGRTFDNPWARATGARSLGLVAAARGRMDDAITLLETALVEHARSQNPFERARTQLALGSTLRRARRRAAARDALSRALELFDELGAAIWAERAASELARIPGRARASRELTETERQVAELVAEGLSNKEVAARLFVTVRTVEANLTKIYAKLGVRSRTELANRLHE